MKISALLFWLLVDKNVRNYFWLQIELKYCSLKSEVKIVMEEHHEHQEEEEHRPSTILCLNWR